MFWNKRDKEVEALQKRINELDLQVNKITWWILNEHYTLIKYLPHPDHPNDPDKVIPFRTPASLETMFDLERHGRNLGMKKRDPATESVEPSTED